MSDNVLGKYELPSVKFGTELVQRAFEVERLRGDFGRASSTPPVTLVQLHALFQTMMSVVSARIEGNRTTIYDAVRSGPTPDAGAHLEGFREIRNIRVAMEFIDGVDPHAPLTHVFVRELHRISVEGLQREGDPTPGEYRSQDVEISLSEHTPPTHVYVHAEMSEWLEFANREMGTAEQMLHVALAHHRFLWIHPFRNGNGRVSRLLSYAMLRRHGFVSSVGLRAVNPTAVFGNDREGYYNALAAADSLSNDGAIEWCTFFVRGIQEDLERLSSLQDFQFVRDELLYPVVDQLVRSGVATSAQGNALRETIARQPVKAGDLAGALPGTASQRSHAIREMLERELLEQAPQGPRFYAFPVLSPVIAPMVIQRLDTLGYLPRILQGDPL